ncbi:c-type cytochrome [Rhodocytophaga aerolata]|uniref:C-type cytochrome n=1 Tax=Rhodocytophaga aerolata TaxID=455078 RepID=A0ABT8R914_9BACT|nr:PVC-type heme-binding CxxCH protein [Rhodocytophaga aerolata]MDO1448577.1 c-type cytochrome [Rhodocytophaga aerolata]
MIPKPNLIKDTSEKEANYRKSIWAIPPAIVALSLVISTAYQPSYDLNKKEQVYDTLYSKLTDEEKRLPENALKGLKVAEGLEAQLFAHEPMLTNPTNIDVDHRGRVWVCEAYNYRPAITGNPTKSEGDRILILEDTDGDSKADKQTVFYQGPELASPLGIWVMGNKAIVSQSPYVWLFTDTDGDDKADKKEVIFQGIEGEQHDHGMHAFTFGPDGKLYFNFGNSGEQLKDAQGNVIKDIDGNEISPKNYKQGMVFRSNPDFTDLEVLGHNFRNNYEVAVDSYGTMWQSDNDDDGNKGVRINYVMEHGNYGYTDEITGAGWRAKRTNMEKEIPLQHWHLNDPGVVPNLLQTGAGSPTGMVVYEGRLLPKTFWDQMIHTDAGPNVVRSYPVTKEGAGYKASIVNILEGVRDQWFRPSDVCVAPDGSLIISDWYDPGVGGHQAGDLNRGRIYRVAPPKTAYTMPKLDLTSVDGAIEALQNPNLSVRYQAWQALNGMGAKAEKKLAKLYKNAENPRMKARSLWLLSKIEGKGKKYIDMALKDANADLRITGLRAAREMKMDIVPYIKQLANDTDAQVRREAVIALRTTKSPEAAQLWATLASQYDGKDRWYLEALGIGADKQWDSFYPAWLKQAGNNPLDKPANRDIIWRARTGQAIPLLAQLASDPSTALDNRLRYFRAFDFNPDGAAKSAALIKMLEGNSPDQAQISQLVLSHLDPKHIRNSPVAMSALQASLDAVAGTQEFVEMVTRYELKEENPRLLKLALAESNSNVGRSAATTLMKQGGKELIKATINGKDEKEAIGVLTALRGVGSEESIQLLEEVALNNSYSLNMRREAAQAIGGSYNGEDRTLELLKTNKLPDELKAAAVSGVSNAWRKSVRTEAAGYLGNTAAAASGKTTPSLNELLKVKGDAKNGQVVFSRTCSTCHQVNGQGMDFGPKLSEIGSKLPKEAQYISILHPDAGISFGYEGYIIKMKDGSTNAGIIASRTETDIDLKQPGGTTMKLKTKDVASMKQMDNSMMPSGLENTMSTQELADLVEYLMSLKKTS